MESGPAEGKPRATIEGSGKVSRNNTVKIRMSQVELLLLDEIGQKLGFAERATTIRTLMEMFGELQQARRVMQTYRNKLEADAAFQAVFQEGEAHGSG